MKKNAPKLVIHRETLRNLDRAAVTGGQAAAVSTESRCVSADDGCPTLSWGVSICGCETDWQVCEPPFINLTDTCAC